MSTATYEPRPGTIVARAIELLRCRGEVNGGELCRLLGGVSSAAMITSLQTAINYRVVKRVGIRGSYAYRLVDEEPKDILPVRQILVPANASRAKIPTGDETLAAFRRMGAVRVEEEAVEDPLVIPTFKASSAPSSPVEKPEVAPELRITLSIECTAHQAERITAFVRSMREAV